MPWLFPPVSALFDQSLWSFCCQPAQFNEGREPVLLRDDVVDHLPGRNLSRPADHHRHAQPTLVKRSFPLPELLARFRIDVRGKQPAPHCSL